MLGEVVKWIMSIANWFIKPRLQIKPAEVPPPQEVKWTKEKQQYWSGYVANQQQLLQKNPRYKSSNGF